MPKFQEFDQRSVASWLSGLGQTLPEFSTRGTASYGTRRRKFVPVTGVTVVRPTGFLNPRSDEYQRVATFLQADLGRLAQAASEAPKRKMPTGDAAKQWYANIEKTQKMMGDLVNRADAAVQRLVKEKSRLTVSKAFMKLAAGSGVDPTSIYVKAVADERSNLQRLYALRGAAFNDYWLSAAPEKYARKLEQLAQFIEDALTAAQIENTQFGLLSLAQAITDQARNILPSPKDLLAMIPWVVGGIALVVAFPFLRELSSTAAAGMRSKREAASQQVQGIRRHRRHW